MTLPLPDNELLRRRHRGLDENRMRWLLSDKLQELPAQLGRAGNVLEVSAVRTVQDVDAEVRGALEGAGLL